MIVFNRTKLVLALVLACRLFGEKGFAHSAATVQQDAPQRALTTSQLLELTTAAINSLPDDRSKVDYLLKLAFLESRGARKVGWALTFQRALKLTDDLTSDSSQPGSTSLRHTLLHQIAMGQADAGLVADATKTVELLRQSVKPADKIIVEMALEGVALRLIDRNELGAAGPVLQRIEDVQCQDRVKCSMALAIARSGEFARALEILETIKSPISRAGAAGGPSILTDGIAQLLAKANRGGEARTLLRNTLANVLATLPDRTPTGSMSPTDIAVSMLVHASATLGELQEALLSVDKIKPETGRENALVQIASLLHERGNEPEASRVMQRVEATFLRARFLAECAGHLAERGATAEAKAKLEKALELLGGVKQAESREERFRQRSAEDGIRLMISAEFLQLGEYATARQVFASTRDPKFIESIISLHEAMSGKFREALATAQHVPEARRGRLLQSLALEEACLHGVALPVEVSNEESSPSLKASLLLGALEGRVGRVPSGRDTRLRPIKKNDPTKRKAL